MGRNGDRPRRRLRTSHATDSQKNGTAPTEMLPKMSGFTPYCSPRLKNHSVTADQSPESKTETRRSDMTGKRKWEVGTETVTAYVVREEAPLQGPTSRFLPGKRCYLVSAREQVGRVEAPVEDLAQLLPGAVQPYPHVHPGEVQLLSNLLRRLLFQVAELDDLPVVRRELLQGVAHEGCFFVAGGFFDRVPGYVPGAGPSALLLTGRHPGECLFFERAAPLILPVAGQSHVL